MNNERFSRLVERSRLGLAEMGRRPNPRLRREGARAFVIDETPEPAPAVSYDFVLRRQAQVEVEQYESLLRRAATTNEPLTPFEWERLTGFKDG